MQPALRVLDPGTHTTLQDFGRFGLQAQGVPVSGALDPLSMRVANALVGNSEAEGVLEILFNGPNLEVCAESVRVALSGTRGVIEVSGERRATVVSGRSVVLRRGQSFRVGRLRDSVCCYLAVGGGFQAEPCLGSVSTYARAGLGGFCGRAIARGDTLPLRHGAALEQEDLRVRHNSFLSCSLTLRIVPGPQQGFFTEEALNTLDTRAFTVSPDSDRMGMRLDGPRLGHRDSFDITSDGIATGAIQVPGSGQPILLLNDHQTTGGYPKIASVISADVRLAGRACPGDQLHFQAVTLEQAEKIRREQERAFRELLTGLAPASPDCLHFDPDALYEENLVSGIVTGDE